MSRTKSSSLGTSLGGALWIVGATLNFGATVATANAQPQNSANEAPATVRSVPIPKSVSPAAQEYLKTRAQQPGFTFPLASDKAAWSRPARPAQNRGPQIAAALQALPVTVDELDLPDVKAYIATPKTLPRGREDKAMIDLHGGALVQGGGEGNKLRAARVAVQFDCAVYEVDYRMPPDHPFPAALDDVKAVYQAMLKKYKPANIAIRGESAGGNLAVAGVLKIRDSGLPLPGVVLLNSPEVDLTESGDSFQANLGADVFLKSSLMQPNLLYAGGTDLTDPYVSPLFADYTKGFPPTYIQTGTRDLFLSNSARFHMKLVKAGVDARLYVGEAMPHTGFGGATPEDADMAAEMKKFLDRVWK